MFELQNHLDKRYDAIARRFPLMVTTPAELADWQQRFRGELASLLGIAGRSLPAAPPSERLAVTDKGRYVEEKHALQLDDVVIPMYLLIPKSPPPYKAIMTFHGHGPGVQLILGDEPDPAVHEANAALDENFAQRFAEAGYLVCAIEQRGFGERVTHQTSPDKQFNSCRHLAFEYMMQGMNLLGERVRDAMASLDYLLSRDDVIPNAVGCTGHSGGGATALFFSALDSRLTISVISGYFCSYKHSILGMAHCECNYVPNLLTLGDIGEIASLIAPRRLRLVNGTQDPIFPQAGVAAPFEVLKSAYTAAGAPESCSLVFHRGAHRYDYAASAQWF